MKTTVEISEGLFKEVKRYAGEKGTTFKDVLESALRTLLKSKAQKKAAFRLRKHGFKGKGLVAGLTEGNWSRIRDQAYTGRGN